MINMGQMNPPAKEPNEKLAESLLSRPRLLDLDGHPLSRMWDAVCRELAEYEVLDSGSEVTDQKAARQASDRRWERRAYRFRDKYLRSEISSVTMSVVAGRKMPIYIMAAGRVFRRSGGFTLQDGICHQVSGVCIERYADVPAIEATGRRILAATLRGLNLKWIPSVEGSGMFGIEAVILDAKGKIVVFQGNRLRPEQIEDKGFNGVLAGYQWTLSLDALVRLWMTGNFVRGGASLACSASFLSVP